MKRRALLASPLLAVFPSAVGAQVQKPWSAKLLQGGFDGAMWWAGISVTLAPNWKTYWRVPGDGGIAPQFQFSGTNLKSSMVHYPLPHRYMDEAGETIGYKNNVVFPVSLTPADPNVPLQLLVNSFFGVCEVVCIPAEFEASLAFSPAEAAAPGQADINAWRKLVPQLPAMPAVSAVKARTGSQGLFIAVELTREVQDIFVEGKSTHYFGRPQIMGRHVEIAVKGAKSLDDLRGAMLRITIDGGDVAVEQNIIVT